ncbi:hypothetical protein [Streptomyces sp. NPDC056192]|uniref:hypothetical protein n=1 Tax=Streptomyces sp. NPDC056192 TaxID=3345743 RepID=UPI0035DA691F
MTTAPAAPQDFLLYGPDGQALNSSTPRRAEQPAAPVGDWKPVVTTDNATVWEKTPTAPAPVEQPAVDHQAAGQAHYEQRIAELEAKLAVLDKPALITHQTAPAPAKAERKGFNHWGPWIALWAAVGLTASGEFALAKFVGFHPVVSALLPIGIDIYVIQAFRRHRDVAAALILMVLTNALVHLAEAGLFGVESTVGSNGETAYEATWWLIVLVSAIAPFIVWRVHRITETRPEAGAATSAETAPESGSRAVAETSGQSFQPVSGSPSDGVAAPRETSPATTATPTETPAARNAETQSHQRETAPATPRATPRRNNAPRPRKAAETGIAAPSKLLSKQEQLAVVGPIVDSWNDGEKDLQRIEQALGCSKATASRRAAEYLDSKSA